MASNLRLLVLEGNTKAACAALADAGGVPNGTLYVNVLKSLFPHADVDLIYPAEADETLPDGSALQSYDGVVLGGSALRINDGDDPAVTRQIELARAVFQSRVPFFGSCWAVQVAALAAGGEVRPAPKGREVGIARKITVTPDGMGHPLYAGKPHVFDALAIHYDEVSHLPPGSNVLASNHHSLIQGVSMTYAGGTFTGVQYHPEFDLNQWAALTRRYGPALIEQGFYADEAAAAEHATLLETLRDDPDRSDIAWMLGLDTDVLDDTIRWAEIRNWVEHIVMPHKAAAA